MFRVQVLGLEFRVVGSIHGWPFGGERKSGYCTGCCKLWEL